MKVTKEAVLAAVKTGATSVSAVGKVLGVKGNISGSTAKAIRDVLPGIAQMLESNKANGKYVEPKVCKMTPVGKKPAAPEAPKEVKEPVTPEAASMKEKASAMKRFEATGTPFGAGKNLAIVFAHGSKDFRPLRDILTDSANDPAFKDNCRKANGGKEMAMGDQNSGRYQRAYWSYTMIRGSHPNNHGVTDWVLAEGETRLKSHDRLVKAVLKA